MFDFDTPELVRALVRLMRRRIALRKRWSVMQEAERRRMEGIFQEAELHITGELERRRGAVQ